MVNANRAIVACAILISCAGCGVVAQHETRSQMQASKANYTECLRNNADDITACEPLRLIYNADLEAYKAAKLGGARVTIDD